MSQSLARSIATISGTVFLCLLAVIPLGHWTVTPAATALLGVSAGCWLGAKHCVRHHREIASQRVSLTGRRW